MPESPESRIAALQAEVAAVRAEMQDFTATVSHDLRAPLRHIVSYVQLVQEDAGPQLNAEVQDFLATISSSARHMGALLDGLTTLSRAGLVPLEMGPVSLQELVQMVRTELMAQCPQRLVEWRITGDLLTVQADVTLLRQVLVQVLGNAVKFTAPRASALIEISTVQGSTADHVALQVRDNGVGYNPALQAQLFRVFGRLHSAKQFEGIGMGLVLSRKILARMGGSVSAEGVVDAGCRVELQLRRA